MKKFTSVVLSTSGSMSLSMCCTIGQCASVGSMHALRMARRWFSNAPLQNASAQSRSFGRFLTGFLLRSSMACSTLNFLILSDSCMIISSFVT